MTGKTKKIIFGIEIVVFIVSLVWLYKSREYEPLIAVLISLAAIIGTIFIKEENDDSDNNNSSNKPKKSKIKQKAGKKSKQYASGGDMTINE